MIMKIFIKIIIIMVSLIFCFSICNGKEKQYDQYKIILRVSPQNAKVYLFPVQDCFQNKPHKEFLFIYGPGNKLNFAEVTNEIIVTPLADPMNFIVVEAPGYKTEWINVKMYQPLELGWEYTKEIIKLTKKGNIYIVKVKLQKLKNQMSNTK